MSAPRQRPGDYSITELAPLIAAREVSPVEVVEDALAVTEELAPGLNCYITVRRKEAVAEARAAESSIASGGYLGPMHGIPVSIKDNIPIAGERTTAGSPALESWVPAHDAACVTAVRRSGATIVAKTNLHEFAFGAPNPRFGPVVNPWNPDRVTGGSSNGSAVAVAARLCHAAIGTDTGGSIRIPASFCGVVGLKPSLGLFDTEGVVPVSQTLDHVGPFARSAADVRLVFDAFCGRGEPTTGDVGGLRIGLPARQSSEVIDPAVERAIADVATTLAAAGATLVEVTLPDLREAQTLMLTIVSVEAAENRRPLIRSGALADYDTYGMLDAAERIPAPDYVHALKRRAELRRSLDAVLREADVILLPATAFPAFPVGQKTFVVDGVEDEYPRAVTLHTALANVTGHPAVAFPCGRTQENCPVGAQLIGSFGAEALLIEVAERAAEATSR